MGGITDFKALTFDCYGTLIDWESGIVAALQPLAETTGRDLSRDDILAAFSKHESPQQSATPDGLYPDVLVRVHDAIAAEWGVRSDPDMARAFGQSVGDWPAFPDSQEALAYLKRHYKLVILSNVDRGSFAKSNERLGVEFDAIYTAQDVGSYKPTPRNFAYMLEHMARDFRIGRHNILHTAESLYHDMVQAKAFGMSTAWIHRRAAQGGFGATRPVGDQLATDFYFTSMAEMAASHRAAMAGEAD